MNRQKIPNISHESHSLKAFNAAFNGDSEAVERLIASKADVNQANTNNATPLYFAAQEGHIGTVQALITARANVNQARTGGVTPLLIAAQKGHIDTVQALITAKADVNQASTDDGITPLFIAAQNGHTDIVQALITARANVNQARTDGTTPLLIAAQKGHIDTVQALIMAKADVNQARTDGRTPLFVAAQEGHTDTVQALITARADVNQAKTSGATPLYIAADQGYTAIVAILKTAQAKQCIDQLKHLNTGDETAIHSDLIAQAIERKTEIYHCLLQQAESQKTLAEKIVWLESVVQCDSKGKPTTALSSVLHTARSGLYHGQCIKNTGTTRKIRALIKSMKKQLVASRRKVAPKQPAASTTGTDLTTPTKSSARKPAQISAPHPAKDSNATQPEEKNYDVTGTLVETTPVATEIANTELLQYKRLAQHSLNTHKKEFATTLDAVAGSHTIEQLHEALTSWSLYLNDINKTTVIKTAKPPMVHSYRFAELKSAAIKQLHAHQESLTLSAEYAKNATRVEDLRHHAANWGDHLLSVKQCLAPLLTAVQTRCAKRAAIRSLSLLKSSMPIVQGERLAPLPVIKNDEPVAGTRKMVSL